MCVSIPSSVALSSSSAAVFPASPSRAAQLEAVIPRLMPLCRRWARTEPEAAELCQEALLVAWSRQESWSEIDHLPAWICGIARNLGRNARRKNRELLLDPELPPPACSRPLPDQLAIRAREVSAVRAALAALPDEEQHVIELRYIQRAAAEEIDREMGLHGCGARAVLQRGRRRLRKSLTEHAPRGARLAG